MIFFLLVEKEWDGGMEGKDKKTKQMNGRKEIARMGLGREGGNKRWMECSKEGCRARMKEGKVSKEGRK